MNFCISYPGKRLKHISGTCASYPHQAMKYEVCEFVCLLTCASGGHIKHIWHLHQHHDFHNLALNTQQKHNSNVDVQMQYSKCRCGSWFVQWMLFPLVVFDGDYLQTSHENQNHVHVDQWSTASSWIWLAIAKQSSSHIVLLKPFCNQKRST